VIQFFEIFILFTCMPITAKINIIITRTNVKFPRAPIVLPIIDINRFNVGQDFANLKTRNLIKRNIQNKNHFHSHLLIETNVKHLNL
jgi:hypothetical protein